ncbi:MULTISPECIES: L,D-transpeptidase [unclassified Devosia]|uniref:L,D-transpeptidase family protein n=1 Tax=unclassified Devosia TaxID=196773 RepID=UPI0015577177|nr:MULTISPECIES: L,D-transpeptidase [unclassified Devosia]
MPTLTTCAARAAFVAVLSIFGSNDALAQSQAITADAINTASLTDYIAAAAFAPAVVQVASNEDMEPERVFADPALARLQILLDRAGASPGVVDGFDGGNLHKAVLAFQMMNGLPADGKLTLAVAARLDEPGDAIGVYTITPEDAAAIGGPIPTDYAEKAALDYLGYESVPELLAERFHMDIGLLVALNPASGFGVGDSINVAMTGTSRQGVVTWIEADKTLKQVRVYGTDGVLLAAYPATIGNEENPSPTGTYVVENATAMPGYTYNPKINFQQGENTEVLTIPPGPNGPVGSVWIGLSKPSFGIHGTPEPSMIDKTGSHGCIRLTNWDAEELAAMIAPGVTVDFL